MTDGSDQRDFERALHESTVIADRIREAISDAPPKLVMLALSDLLQEYLTRLVELNTDSHQGGDAAVGKESPRSPPPRRV
jgi:hypothetical protein